MAASYPGTIKPFSTKAPGQAIASSHINDLQNEVVAVETQLVTSKLASLSDAPVGNKVLTSIAGTPTWVADTTFVQDKNTLHHQKNAMTLNDNVVTDVLSLGLANNVVYSFLVGATASPGTSPGYAARSALWLVSVRCYSEGATGYSQAGLTSIGTATAGSKTSAYLDVDTPVLSLSFSPNYLSLVLSFSVNVSGTGGVPTAKLSVDVTNLSIPVVSATWLK